MEPTLNSLKKGQLRVVVEQGKRIVGSDKSLQCYIVLRLAESGKGKLKKKTKTTPVVTNGNPKFNETFSFNVKDMKGLVKAIGKSGR